MLGDDKDLAAFIAAHPELSWQDIAHERSVSIATVCRVSKKFGLSRGRGKRPTLVETGDDLRTEDAESERLMDAWIEKIMYYEDRSSGCDKTIY